MEKAREKENFYDKMSLSESTLSIFIVFGLILTALAIGLGYFKGNNGGAAVPAGIDRREESESAEGAFAKEDGRQHAETETEILDEANE